MDTTARRRKINTVVLNTSNNIYTHDVSMYSTYPDGEITLTEFEDVALDRLNLLRILEQASLKGHKVYSDDWKTCVKEDLIKAKLKRFVRLMMGYNSNSEQDFQARRADFISHHILKLAYCRSEELRRWFLNREMEWFRLRFMAQTATGVLKFLEINNMTYTPISSEEKEKIFNELEQSTANLSHVGIESTNFYKVPFGEVCSLVKNRRVYVQMGFAYIPSSELIVCIQSKFRAVVNEALNICNRKMPYVDDERLDSLLSNMHQTYTGKDYTQSTNKEGIDPGQLDNYSKSHFPMCMRHLHTVLRNTHHLKHYSRLQYGLFLKGIGLSYEDAMDFWRSEFTKIMDLDKYEKGYSYNFKHQYGKVGQMTNYSPYSCLKIITGNVGPGEQHGCPFKHWDPAVLKNKLNEHGVSSEGAKAINDLVTNGHYQIACSKYFEVIHDQPPVAINHPNQYFEESFKIAKEKQSKTN